MSVNLAAASIVRRLDSEEQARWVEAAREVARQAPFRHPHTRSGQQLRVKVTSAGTLGWWSAEGRGYHYTPQGPCGPWPPIPQEWIDLANDVAGFHDWNTALLNWYAPGSGLGWHEDKSEQNTLPIVTVSLGDAATWGIRNDKGKPSFTRLESGDVTILAGPTRRLEHSIEKIEPAELLSPLKVRGRLSITIRVAGAQHQPGRAPSCRALGACEREPGPSGFCAKHERFVPRNVRAELARLKNGSPEWTYADARALAFIEIGEQRWSITEANGYITSRTGRAQ